MKQLRLETIEYQLEKNGPWLKGVLVNEGDGPIINMEGKVVPSKPGVWDYWRRNEQIMTVYDKEE